MVTNPTRQSGAERASRIQLQYYKGWDRRSIWRVVTAAAGLIFTLAYVLYSQISGDDSQSKYSRGPISASHASFENNCSMCHDTRVAGEPIHSNAYFRSEDTLKLINKKCTQCHKTGNHLSPEIHSSTGHKELSCTACHSEHRGRQFNPATVNDQKCVDCHKEGVGKKPNEIHPPVTAFNKDGHPAFFGHLERVGRSGHLKDPGNVQFNHALHLKPGIYEPASTIVRNHPMMWSEILETDKRYGKNAKGEVVLQCSDCHEAGTATSSGTTSGSALGGDMSPIRFEEHCRACHPLSIGKGIRLEHGLAPSVLEKTIDGIFQQSILSHGDLSKEALTALKDTGAEAPSLAVLKSISGQSADELKAFIEDKGALMRLKLTAEATCFLCHDWSSLHPSDSDLSRHRVHPPPQGWLKFGYFPHVQHAGVSCEKCHTQSRQSNDASDVALRDMQSKCFQCHQSGVADLKGPIAGSNCVDCHFYHRARLEPGSGLLGPTSYQVKPRAFELEAPDSLGGKE